MRTSSWSRAVAGAARTRPARRRRRAAALQHLGRGRSARGRRGEREDERAVAAARRPGRALAKQASGSAARPGGAGRRWHADLAVQEQAWSCSRRAGRPGGCHSHVVPVGRLRREPGTHRSFGSYRGAHGPGHTRAGAVRRLAGGLRRRPRCARRPPGPAVDHAHGRAAGGRAAGGGLARSTGEPRSALVARLRAARPPRRDPSRRAPGRVSSSR